MMMTTLFLALLLAQTPTYQTPPLMEFRGANAGNWARVPLSTAGLNLAQGTIEFSYTPTYNTGDGTTKSHVLGLGTQNAPGSCWPTEHSDGWSVICKHSDGKLSETKLAENAHPTPAGVPVLVRITWDFVTSGQNVRIWLDGIEYSTNCGAVGSTCRWTTYGFRPMPAAPNDYLYICSSGALGAGARPCNGTIAALKAWDIALP